MSFAGRIIFTTYFFNVNNVVHNLDEDIFSISKTIRRIGDKCFWNKHHHFHPAYIKNQYVLINQSYSTVTLINAHGAILE